MPFTPLTTSARLTRLLSEVGVISFSDHEELGEEDTVVVDECIQFAGAMILGILIQRYTATALSLAVVLGEYATIIAARTLCMRRGNPIPESLEMRYQELVAVPGGILDMLAKGVPKMVDADGNVIAGRGGYCPRFSNLTVDRRYRQEQIRVLTGSSSTLPTSMERDTALEVLSNE